jgi:hypothetical protein
MLAAVLFSVCSEKTLWFMDQTLMGRSHLELVNSFAKKTLGKISENHPAYKSSNTGLKQKGNTVLT